LTGPSAIDRREALRRVALLLGGTLSAPAIAGVLAGCSSGAENTATWKPRAFSAEQGEIVATIADHIIPRTDTPGARDVGVHRFIDTMMAEYYTPPVRERFTAGLADLDARATRAHRKHFRECDVASQQALVTALDTESFSAPPPHELPWFRTMKELTLLGYYTSGPGATKELRYEAVPGRYDGCVPLATVGRTWAV
jgi:gluconate 2-dehydrogenase gamma chain